MIAYKGTHREPKPLGPLKGAEARKGSKEISAAIARGNKS